jgi:hypothetical protein
VSTASPARIAANKANAQRSTGPRTEAGKARVSENALKHGLRSARNPLDLAKDTALPFEQAEFLATLATFVSQFAPQSPIEILLVERLAQIDLRLNRAIRMETAHMEHHAEAVWKNVGELLPTDPRSRDNQLLMLTFDRAAATIKLIHQYESRLSRDFARTLTQLRAAQKSREQSQQDIPQNTSEQTQATEREDQPSAASHRGVHSPNTNKTPQPTALSTLEKMDDQTQPLPPAFEHPLQKQRAHTR